MNFWIVALILTLNIQWSCGPDITILHIADTYGRYDENSRHGGRCYNALREKTRCVGGLARVHHLVKKFRAHSRKFGNYVVFFFNGNFLTGTEWSHYFGFDIAADFMNLLRPDVVSLGHHEFDIGINALKKFINKLKVPVVAANVNDTTDPGFFMGRANFTVNGLQFGVVGVMSARTKEISNAEDTVIFSDEVTSIKEHTQILHQQKVKVIIVLTSVGFVLDKKIAYEVPHVDVIIGGMSKTFLYTGPIPDIEEKENTYPHIVIQSDGRKVAILHAYAYSKYLGVCNMSFTDEGILYDFDGRPIILTARVNQDEEALNLLDKYRKKVEKYAGYEAGKVSVIIEGTDQICGIRECTLGNLVSDAFVEYATAHNFSGTWTQASIGIVHAGTLTFSIDARDNNGIVEKRDLFLCLPYANKLAVISLYGETLKRMLEESVGATTNSRFLQVSGLHIVYDKKQRLGNRITRVTVRCSNCSVPKYEPLDPSAVYGLILPEYLTRNNEGYGHVLNSKTFFNKRLVGKRDVDAVLWYFRKNSPIHPELYQRILVAEVPRIMSMGSRVFAMSPFFVLIWRFVF